MTTQRTYLITGASKGIRRALSQRLAAAGFPGTLVPADLADRQQADESLAGLVRPFRFHRGASMGRAAF